MLIETLIEYRNKKGHNITVVFDGWKTGGAQENQSVIGGIKVIYSSICYWWNKSHLFEAR